MWVLEPDLGPLQKQVLLSTKPSLNPCNFILVNYLALSILLWQWENELMRKCDRRPKGQNSVSEQLKMEEICSFQFSTKEE